MKTVLLLIAAASIAGCGVEMAGTAATAGSIKKRELEQGQKTMKDAQQRIDASMQQATSAPARRFDPGIESGRRKLLDCASRRATS